MEVFADGNRRGSISGGCLEADVVERSRQVARTDRACYVRYDSRTPVADFAFELGWPVTIVDHRPAFLRAFLPSR